MAQKSNTNDFIKKSMQKHGNKYDYSKSNYINNRIKVCIICPKHGEFWQTPHDHLYGCGCPLCNQERKKIPRISFEKFKNLANKIHNNKYSYNESDYNGVTNKIRITCPIHGEFTQTPQNHLYGQGCPACGNKNKGNYQKKNTELFIKKAFEIHGNKYDYSKVNYVNNRTKICIICPKHGEFYQKPLDHIHGCGCPECGKTLNKSERIVLDALISKYKNVLYQHKEQWLKSKTSYSTIDFYLPDYKIGVEYQGRQHFIPIKRFGGENAFLLQTKRDLIKYKNCLLNGVKMFYISFEKCIPKDYFGKVYTTTNELINAIDKYIENM